MKLVNVNHRAEAGLYHRVIGGSKTSAPLGYKRFRTAAGAIRFAIEQLPKKLLLGASLEVGDGASSLAVLDQRGPQETSRGSRRRRRAPPREHQMCRAA